MESEKHMTEERRETGKMAEQIVAVWRRIGQTHPLVHMIPNSVTAALCTDGLSALGARPLMASSPEEMDEIPAHADAVVINMGQPGREKLEAARKALLTAARCRVPVVWDPVGAGASRFRREEYARLAQLPWTGIVKGNRSEIASLQSGRIFHQGIDSIGEFSLKTRAEDGRVWAVSGREDLVFDGRRCFRLDHGAEKKLMLTGSGCLTGAVMGACSAVEEDCMTAALTAFLIMGYAGSRAAGHRGYGSQKTALLDELTCIDGELFAGYVGRYAGGVLDTNARSTNV